ncbi:Cystine-knot domain [Homalodisca vitripennis]|nr:Cystine-knot domain [Homalodisca vitripennis]
MSAEMLRNVVNAYYNRPAQCETAEGKQFEHLLKAIRLPHLKLLNISDWRFPYKRSYHPVCLHDSRELTTTILRNCDPDVEPGTERYQFLQALSCRCLVCKSSEASCEGLRNWKLVSDQA